MAMFALVVLRPSAMIWVEPSEAKERASLILFPSMHRLSAASSASVPLKSNTSEAAKRATASRLSEVSARSRTANGTFFKSIVAA